MKKLVGIYLIIFPVTVFCSDLFSPLIKIGMNGNKIVLHNSSTNFDYHDYSYPLGYSLGLSNETYLSEDFYITNSLYWKHIRSQMYFTPAGGILPPYNIYKFNHIRFSPLLGLRIANIIDVLIGIDVGRLINLNIRTYYHDGDFCCNFKPDNFPKFDTALCFGIGKDLRIGSEDFKIELKYLYGLTEYIYFSNVLGGLPGPTRNHSLQLEFGYRLFN